jgi:ribosomal subunit interface protein
MCQINKNPTTELGMQLDISGRHVNLGDSFRTHAETRLQDNIHKYIDRVNHIEVVVSKEAGKFRVDIHGNTGTHSGLVVKSTGHGDDVYGAFDEAAARVEKQLRRYKRRLKDHHASERVEPFVAKKYVLQPESHADELTEEGAPAVIAEKDTAIETLSVSQAVMRMDLADLPALMFYNSANGRINVVYRRLDGNISWVDPEEQKAANAA